MSLKHWSTEIQNLKEMLQFLTHFISFQILSEFSVTSSILNWWICHKIICIRWFLCCWVFLKFSLIYVTVTELCLICLSSLLWSCLLQWVFWHVFLHWLLNFVIECCELFIIMKINFSMSFTMTSIIFFV